MKQRLSTWVFVFLISLFYGVMAAGQIAGLAKLYYPWLVLPFSLIIILVIVSPYKKYGDKFLFVKDNDCPMPGNRWLDTAFLISGLGVFFLLVFYQLIRWPFSPISTNLPWDAGLYHFPKAIEMIVTHSIWDLTIAYGEYPFGYETLIAVAFLLNRSGFLVGMVHALISLFFLLTIWLLICRRTRIPAGLVVLIISFILVSRQIFPHLDSNIWWMFWPEVTLIGKNDLLNAATMLAVLYHIPHKKNGPFFPIGLAVVSMVAMSIKPNAVLVIIYAWFMMIFFLVKARRFYSAWKQLLLSMFIMAPGGLWIVRNFLGQGSLFSTDSLGLFDWSIAGNLSNPFFYNYIPPNLFIVLGLIVVTFIVSIFKKSLRRDVLSSFILLISFTITPASAFFGSTTVPTQVAWRFSLALMAYVLLLFLALLDPLILPVYRWIAHHKIFSVASAVIIVAIGMYVIWIQRDLMESFPKNEIVLHDQFRDSVGVDGYHSPYDYIQTNVHESIVNVEYGLPFYLYDPGLTNSVTRSQPADYIVYIKRPWTDVPPYSQDLSKPAWTDLWELVYEDAEGRVYKRR